MKKFDIAIIGSGPGGYVAAIRAAKLGKSVALIEKHQLGGVCLNWGCIPTKTLLKAAKFYQDIQTKAKTLGIQLPSPPKLHYPQLIQHSRHIAQKLNQGIQYLLKKNKIQLIPGHAYFQKPHLLQIDSPNSKQTIQADYIILATGARPKNLPHLRADGKHIWHSHHALENRTQPKSILIIGAGAIGVEFAYFFNAIGTKVTLVEMQPHILPQEDEEISQLLSQSLQKQGITIKTSTTIQQIQTKKNYLEATLQSNQITETLHTEKVLLAIGIQPNIENLGLDAVEIELQNNGWIQTNPYGQTNLEHVFAIGDVAGPPWLAHVASHQGILAVETICGKETQPLQYDNIPSCTYCYPQVASVGLSEKQATQQGYQIQVGRFPLFASGKALASSETEGMIKIISDKNYGEILGCHILASDATELISHITLGRHAEITYHELLHTIFPHPTLSEIIPEATWDMIGEPIHI